MAQHSHSCIPAHHLPQPLVVSVTAVCTAQRVTAAIGNSASSCLRYAVCPSFKHQPVVANRASWLQAALDCMTDSRLFALSARHVTVSTVGVTDKIRALARDAPTARLALSLHAPTQELRERIVPSAKAYKLPALLGAVRDYVEATGNRVFVEYVMLRGVNDEAEHAQQLAAVLADLPVTVNLIPWNPVLSPDISFEAPGLERVRLCCI